MKKPKRYQFRDDVLDLCAKSKTYAQIYETIRVQGYTGTQDAIRGWVTKEQRIVDDFQSKFGQTEFLEKKWIYQQGY